MKRLSKQGWLALVVCFLIGCGVVKVSTHSSNRATHTDHHITLKAKPKVTANLVGRVVRVSDGDTIILLVGTTTYKVRLNQIDAPEKQQAFGQVSKKALIDKIGNQTIRVEVTGTDRYHRSLGILYKGDTNINLQMVEDGYAWAYKAYLYDPAYLQAQEHAQQAKRGLWQDPNAMPPWEWRKAHRDR